MLKNLFSGFKSKVLALFSLGSVSAFAATGLTMSTDGTVSGSFDLSNVYVIGGAVFAALAAIAVISIAFKMVRKAG